MAYANSLNPAQPADGNYLREGDDRIRETRAGFIERMETVFVSADGQPLAFIAGIIPTAALADSAVTALKLADGAVDTAAIVDSSVTNAKIVSLDGSKILDNTISGTKLQDLAVTLSKLVNGAVDSTKLADLAATTSKIALLAVTGAQVADDTLDDPKLAVHLRNNLLKQSHIDPNIAGFTLATDTSVDTAAMALGGALTTDNVIVTPDGAAAAVFTAPQKLMQFYAFCDAPGSVKIRFINTSGGPITMPTINWRIMAIRRYSDWYP